MALNLEVNILGDYKKLTKATQGAEKQLGRFGKTGAAMSKKLGRAFAGLGAAFGAARLGRFMLDSAKAAGEDARAQRLLAMTLERNAQAKKSDVANTEAMIGRMQLATGVADDFLRPAMGKLAAVTGDVNKAQELLKIALGVSAKYGKPLEAVASSLAKAFKGNTTSLTRMIPQLKDSKDLFGDLKKDVKGFAAANADPFERLNRGIDDFKEKIGKPLADRFAKLMDKIGKPGSPEAKAIDSLAGSFDQLTTSFSTFFKIFDPAGTSGFVGFVNATKTLAGSIGLIAESFPAFGKLLTGKKLDPKEFPTLYQVTAPGRQFTSQNKTKSALVKQAAGPLAKYGVGQATKQTNNINITTTKAPTPEEVARLLREWQKKHGVKTTGPLPFNWGN